MACCHPTEQAGIHSVAFTEPSAVASATFVLLPETVPVRIMPDEAGFFSPLSPPPKAV
jgi:hypothetical protein